jgi:hypothetical protein
VNGLISEIIEDVLDQIGADMKASPYFALQLEESTAFVRLL